LARGGDVTPLAGSLCPDCLVLMQFPTADEVVAFYFQRATRRYFPFVRRRPPHALCWWRAPELCPKARVGSFPHDCPRPETPSRRGEGRLAI